MEQSSIEMIQADSRITKNNDDFPENSIIIEEEESLMPMATEENDEMFSDEEKEMVEKDTHDVLGSFLQHTKLNYCARFIVCMGCLAVFVAVSVILLLLNYDKVLKNSPNIERTFTPIDPLQTIPFNSTSIMKTNTNTDNNSNVVNIYIYDRIKYREREMAQLLPVNVVVGLLNRNAPIGKPVAHVILREVDYFWIREFVRQQEQEQNTSTTRAQINLIDTTFNEMLHLALEQNLIKGKVLYEYSNDPTFPAVVSFAAIYDALPIPVDKENIISVDNENRVASLPIILDVREEETWGRRTNDNNDKKDIANVQIEQTKYIINTVLEYSNDRIIAMQKPSLLKEGFLVDYLVSKKITTVWMKAIENPFSKRHQLFQKFMSTNSHWNLTEQPLSIMGYYGGLFEEVGMFAKRKSELSLVSDFVSGLSFYEKMPTIPYIEQHSSSSTSASALSSTTTTMTTEPSSIKYDPTKVYVALITSDGDNIQIVQDNIMREFREKQLYCDNAYKNNLDMNVECPKISWTIQGRINEMAPTFIQYYYETSKKYKRDTFLLGPSGYGYLYPSLIQNDADARQFAHLTNSLASRTNMTAYAHWDWAGTFPFTKRFIKKYFSTDNNVIEGIFLSVVPYFLPQFTFNYEDVIRLDNNNGQRDKSNNVNEIQIFYECLNWSFDPRDGTTWSPEEVAIFFNKRKPGSLNFVYKIYSIPTKYVVEMARNLSSHVELVDYKELIELRKQKNIIEGYPKDNYTYIYIFIFASIMIGGTIIIAFRWCCRFIKKKTKTSQQQYIRVRT